MFDDIVKIILSGPLVALISVYVGYHLSNKQWLKQTNHKNQSIARGFDFEIAALGELIEPLLDGYKKNGGFSVGCPYVLNTIIKETNSDLSKVKSVYDKDGLFFHFRKEIYNFDDDLVLNFIKFYENVLQADKYYQMILNSKGVNERWNVQDDFFNHLKEAYILIPNLRSSLKVYTKE